MSPVKWFTEDEKCVSIRLVQTWLGAITVVIDHQSNE